MVDLVVLVPTRDEAANVAAVVRRVCDALAPAPFSWEPDRVTVADSGVTAVSSGPVRDPGGKMVARFTTVWHKDVGADGARWRVIVDQGVPLAECSPPGR